MVRLTRIRTCNGRTSKKNRDFLRIYSREPKLFALANRGPTKVGKTKHLATKDVETHVTYQQDSK